ncbi:hypothetical protein BDZ89DRAFT_1127582 [Hymenopellis radicata]|nr:hypothetical protein BDZ89DRAFT_1127582 [Hymenopellis radicata]
MPPPQDEYVDVEIPNVVSPRINGKRMLSFVGKEVRIPCQIVSKDLQNHKFVAQTCDGLTITLSEPDLDKLLVGEYVEAVATVLDDQNAQVNTLIVMVGSNIDFAIIDAVIELIHQPRFFRTIFAPATYE